LLGLFPLSASAEGGECTVNVLISADATNVKVGESVILTASSIKKGSSYEVNWDGAVDQGTVLDTTNGTYISTAEFSADTPGVYQVEYSIILQAGKSDKCFGGKAVKIITVSGEEKSIVGADIKDLLISPVVRKDGSEIYSAFGTSHVLWSDNTSKPYGAVYFYFQENEYSKNIDVTFNIDGKAYCYTVTVTRPDIN